MKNGLIGIWLKAGIIRNRQRDAEKIRSMIDSAETNAKVVKTIRLTDDSATLIFREIYESIRMLGDAKWWILGYEPSNHEISLETLKEFEIKINSEEFTNKEGKQVRVSTIEITLKKK